MSESAIYRGGEPGALDTPWDRAYVHPLRRGGSVLEPGVSYFILMLERLGCRTYFSCEGHPNGFYIVFKAQYKTAFALSGIGYFTYEICNMAGTANRQNMWTLRNTVQRESMQSRNRALRWASVAWEKSIRIMP